MQACGLLEARSPAARAVAVEAAVGRVARTLDWVKREKFLEPRQAAKVRGCGSWLLVPLPLRPLPCMQDWEETQQQGALMSRQEMLCTAGHCSLAAAPAPASGLADT